MKGWNPSKKRKSQLSDKTIADCVESLVGATFVVSNESNLQLPVSTSGGNLQIQMANATMTIISFGIPLKRDGYLEEYNAMLT